MYKLIGMSLSEALATVGDKEVFIIRNDSDKLKNYDDDLIVRVREEDNIIYLTVSHFMTKVMNI